MTADILQINLDAPNPVQNLSGYVPTTDYWKCAIRLANALIIAATVDGFNAKQLQVGANHTIGEEIFAGNTHTPVEWAEFVMAINHVLWLLHAPYEERAIETLEPVLQALNDLYYEWHNKALDTLKGGELSTYLRITD